MFWSSDDEVRNASDTGIRRKTWRKKERKNGRTIRRSRKKRSRRRWSRRRRRTGNLTYVVFLLFCTSI